MTPELVLPDQFHEVWRAVKTLTPERELAASVVWQAALDLATCRNAASRKKRQLYWKAYHWVISNDRAWPFSFLNLCDTLGLSTGLLRRELLKGGWPGRIDAVCSAA